ncbi:MAG: acetyl-CoA carboxylase carboxyltransferase subunit alpha, partial [Acetobacteraceae bacterium]
AAEALKLTADDLLRMKLVDTVIAEPLGGAQRDPQATIHAVGEAVQAALLPLLDLDPVALVTHRQERYLEIGRDVLMG